MSEEKITVRLTTSMAGVDHAHAVGDELELDTTAARRLLDAGFAEPVAQTPASRADTRPAPEAPAAAPAKDKPVAPAKPARASTPGEKR